MESKEDRAKIFADEVTKQRAEIAARVVASYGKKLNVDEILGFKHE